MSTLDPITLQVITGALRAACEEMGAVLVQAAHSANIKERRDCSTALFTPDGAMLMQAEHIPVHLGAMPAAVAAVAGRDAGARAAPGSSTTRTRAGRTCRTSPWSRRRSTPAASCSGFAASRAHHADVGGPTPGSMPADSTTLADEGVVIPPSELTDALIEELVAQMRRPEQRRADLRAQLAANRVGVARLSELARPDRRRGAAGRRRRRARLRRAAHARLPGARSRTATRTATDVLEGARGRLELRVPATVARRRADARLQRQRAAAPRQPQLPARRDGLRLPVRGARPHRPGHPAERGRAAPGRPSSRRAGRC